MNDADTFAMIVEWNVNGEAIDPEAVTWLLNNCIPLSCVDAAIVRVEAQAAEARANFPHVGVALARLRSELGL